MATTRTVNINLKDILGDAASSAVCVFSPITSNLASSVDVAIGAPARVVMASDGTAQTTLVVPTSDAYKYECLIRDANSYTANRFQFTLGTGDPTTLAAIMADSNVAGTTTNTSLETALQAVLPNTTISTINVVDLNASGTVSTADLSVSGSATIDVASVGTISVVDLTVSGSATISYDATQNITISGTLTAGAVSASVLTVSSSATVSGTLTALDFIDSDNSATGIKAQALGGSANVASANYSKTTGLQAKAELLSAAAHASGQFSAVGDAQVINLVARRSITGTTSRDLYLDGGTLVLDNYFSRVSSDGGTTVSQAHGTEVFLDTEKYTPSLLQSCDSGKAGLLYSVFAFPNTNTTGRLTIPTNTVWSIFVQVVAVVDESGTGGPTQGACCSKLVHGILSNVGGTVTLLAQKEVDKLPGGSTGTTTLVADNVNKALRVNFTPPNSAVSDTVMRVVASVQIAQSRF